MKGNKLVTGIVIMVELIVGKGEYELLAQSFDETIEEKRVLQFLFRWKRKI